MPKTKSSDIAVYHRSPLQPQCNQRLQPSSVRGRIPHCIRPLLARTLVVQSAHRLLAACLLSLRMASSGLSAVFRRVDAVARRRPPLPPPLPGLANILLVPKIVPVVFMPMPLLPSFTFLSCLLSLFLIKKRGGQRPQQIVGRRMLLMDTFTVHVHVPVRKKMLHM